MKIVRLASRLARRAARFFSTVAETLDATEPVATAEHDGELDARFYDGLSREKLEVPEPVDETPIAPPGIEAEKFAKAMDRFRRREMQELDELESRRRVGSGG